MAEMKLEPVVAGDSVELFSAGILANRNENLTINASDVTRIDTPCIEVLLSAKKLWVEDLVSLQIENPSQAFNTALLSLGLNNSMLETGENA